MCNNVILSPFKNKINLEIDIVILCINIMHDCIVVYLESKKNIGSFSIPLRILLSLLQNEGLPKPFRL